jgi:hypothetical protein
MTFSRVPCLLTPHRLPEGGPTRTPATARVSFVACCYTDQPRLYVLLDYTNSYMLCLDYLCQSKQDRRM